MKNKIGGKMAFQIAISLFVTTCLYDFTQAQQSYAQAALESHNQYPSKHQVGAMTLSDELNQLAVQCAEYYADIGQIDHSCPHIEGEDVGENLYWTSESDAADVDVSTASCDDWYSESEGYDYNEDYQKGKGHFSQMVWKGSNELGFGTAQGNGKTVVGIYRPQGNIIGQFKDNVFPPKK